MTNQEIRGKMAQHDITAQMAHQQDIIKELTQNNANLAAQCVSLQNKNEELTEENKRLERVIKGPMSERIEYLSKEAASPTGLMVNAVGVLCDVIHSSGESRRTDIFDMVARFNDKFGLGYEGRPRLLPADLQKLKIMHLNEELAEYRNATENKKLEDCFDALIDLVYVALGTAYAHGFDFNEGFRRVHYANMQKKRALKKEDSKRGSIFDIIKPKNWKPATLKDLV